MKAKINVKPWRTCSNNTENTAMSPETHTIQTTHFHRMIHYQRIQSQKWLIPPPGHPQGASRALEGLEDISTTYIPWPRFGQISGVRGYLYQDSVRRWRLNARVSHGSSCFPIYTCIYIYTTPYINLCWRHPGISRHSINTSLFSL